MPLALELPSIAEGEAARPAPRHVVRTQDRGTTDQSLVHCRCGRKVYLEGNGYGVLHLFNFDRTPHRCAVTSAATLTSDPAMPPATPDRSTPQ